ncbi:putative mitochondrial protein, conserved [Agyrium rufum]|nr:putative mitochondrial protein, conserved [Agyrium rufum]
MNYNRLSRHLWLSRRNFATFQPLCASPPFNAGPAPPRLPEEDQKLYERLQQESTGAFSTPRPTIVVNQSSASSISAQSTPKITQSPYSPSVVSAAEETPSSQPKTSSSRSIETRLKASGDGEELHPNIRRGAKAEFEGERNPKTGEVGGPKNDPLRWGGDVDWSYNGRVTDF